MLKDNLKALRKQKGLSQEELSIKLNVVRQTISKWESMKRKQKRKLKINTLIIAEVFLILLFILFIILNSPYQSWDYNDAEWTVIGTIWHSFEWIFFRFAPIIVITITIILGIIFVKRNK